MARDIETIELEIESLELIAAEARRNDDTDLFDEVSTSLDKLYAEADDHYDRYNGEDVMMDEEMDGDHGSALASAGFGTDEDYEHNDIDGFDFPEFDE